MNTHPSQPATSALAELAHGDDSATERLCPLVYEELRALAGHYFRNQRADQTLQPTALAHEAYMRLIDQTATGWRDRAHFMAIAATAMRQILADHARRRGAAKRGGGWQRVTLNAVLTPHGASELDALALDEALSELSALDPRKYRVVELRFFASLTVEEIAELLAISVTTVEADWRAARAWLSIQLSKGTDRDT